MLSRITRTAERSEEPELMDDLAIQGEELELTLEELELINRAFGGYTPSLEGLAALVPDGAARVHVLDVGTGGADTARRMVEWGRARGVDVRVTGIDLAETTVARARRLSRSHPEIDVELRDLFDLPDDQTFDVVHAAAVLHHFPGLAAARALKKMYALARWGVVINDLHRHPLAWASAKLVIGTLSRSRLVKNDAAVSVQRAFTKADFVAMCEEAGLPAPELAWRPMFRWRVVIRR